MCFVRTRIEPERLVRGILQKTGGEILNWYFWTVVFGEDSWEPLGLQEIKPVNPKGNQSWIFIGKTDAKAEAPKLWPPDAKNWPIGTDPDAGKDASWRQEEKGTREDEKVGWHHRLDGHEFEKLWELVMDREAWLTGSVHGGRKELDTTEQLNWTKILKGE